MIVAQQICDLTFLTANITPHRRGAACCSKLLSRTTPPHRLIAYISAAHEQQQHQLKINKWVTVNWLREFNAHLSLTRTMVKDLFFPRRYSKHLTTRCSRTRPCTAAASSNYGPEYVHFLHFIPRHNCCTCSI